MRCCRARTERAVQKLYNLFTFSFLLYVVVLCDYFGYFSSSSSSGYDPIERRPKHFAGADNNIFQSAGDNEFIPDIYVVTATYKRWTQKADLTRLAHSFLLSNSRIHWVVVEDTKEATPNLMLKKFKRYYEEFSQKYQPCVGCLRIDLLVASTPDNVKLKKDDPNWLFPRGANQRNQGLDFINSVLKNNPNSANQKALLYFADDDNTYHSNLFPTFKTFSSPSHQNKLIGLVPTGISGGLKWEGPICDQITGEILNFHTAWRPERPFPIDMASFVLKIEQFVKTQPRFSSATRRGYLESDFLIKYLNVQQYLGKFSWDQETLELMRAGQPLFSPDPELNRKLYSEHVVGLNCQELLVWHTQTVKPKDRDEIRLVGEGRGSRELEY